MVRKILNILSTVLLVILVAVVVMIFISRMSGKTPTIFGYSIFRVSSESMEPTLKVKDVILVKSCDPEDIQIGDIITYKGAKGELAGKMVTHRVIEGPEKVSDYYVFRTKGDKEGAVPDPRITDAQIEGKFVRTLPFIDRMYTFFLSPVGLITFIGVIVILFGYEMISLVLSYKAIDSKDDDYYAPPNRKPKKKRVKNKNTAQKQKTKKKTE